MTPMAETAEPIPALRIDDLHWADSELIDLLRHLVTALGRQQFVLLTSMRPGSEVEWPTVGDRTNVVTLALQPLTRDETAELTTALLGDSTTPATLSTLYDRSGGNPLFLIELVALTGTRGDHGEDECEHQNEHDGFERGHLDLLCEWFFAERSLEEGVIIIAQIV